MSTLESRTKAQALGLGFGLVGITRTGPADTAAAFDRWLDDGRAGTMDYLGRRADERRDTRRAFAGARSAIVVALNYGGTEPTGPVARYARGDDYHDLMWRRLDALHEWLSAEVGAPVAARGFVDTGPILERDLARRAGLGWFGKNTMLIHPEHGSFFFLGALLVDLELEPDTPFDADRCGTCTRCIDACPTAAITAPRELDARRCISYLTIELRGAIPTEFREAVGDHLYGCDVCQDVCPWNVSFADTLREPALQPRAAVAGRDAATLATEILSMDDAAYQQAFRGSAMKRAKLAGLKRNAAVVLGNVGSEDDMAALRAAATSDDPIVAEHARWSLARLDRSQSP